VLDEWYIIVAAQIVNFLILVGLLKWLLFDRVVRAMDEREETIASRLHEADAKQRDADERAESLRAERRELEDRRQQMLDDARREADQRLKELTAQARDEVDRMGRRWKETLRRQQGELLARLQRHGAEALGRAVRQALAEVAGADLDRRAARVFLERLSRLGDEDRDALARALSETDGRVELRSAARLDEKTRGELREAVGRAFGREVHVEFRESPDLLAGVELQAGGLAIGWSLDDYSERLAEQLREALDAETRDTGDTADPQDGPRDEGDQQAPTVDE
jgi:F-type H+-transporting ATPase subunit b